MNLAVGFLHQRVNEPLFNEVIDLVVTARTIPRKPLFVNARQFDALDDLLGRSAPLWPPDRTWSMSVGMWFIRICRAILALALHAFHYPIFGTIKLHCDFAQ